MASSRNAAPADHFPRALPGMGRSDRQQRRVFCNAIRDVQRLIEVRQRTANGGTR